MYTDIDLLQCLELTLESPANINFCDLMFIQARLELLNKNYLDERKRLANNLQKIEERMSRSEWKKMDKIATISSLGLIIPILRKYHRKQREYNQSERNRIVNRIIQIEKVILVKIKFLRDIVKKHCNRSL